MQILFASKKVNKHIEQKIININPNTDWTEVFDNYFGPNVITGIANFPDPQILKAHNLFILLDDFGKYKKLPYNFAYGEEDILGKRDYIAGDCIIIKLKRNTGHVISLNTNEFNIIENYINNLI